MCCLRLLSSCNFKAGIDTARPAKPKIISGPLRKLTPVNLFNIKFPDDVLIAGRPAVKL